MEIWKNKWKDGKMEIWKQVNMEIGKYGNRGAEKITEKNKKSKI